MSDTSSRIAIVGAGRVGRALGARWLEAGHDVVFGVREPSDPRHADLGAPALSVADAAAAADVVVLATPWAATEQAARAVASCGAIIVDATNPLADMAMDPRAVEAGSGAALVAGWTGSHRVVKAFNSTGTPNMADTTYPGGTPMMPVAGDDAAAREVVLALARDAGFDAVDAGPLDAAADLEHLAMLWIRLAFAMGNGPGIAFALLRR